LELFLCHHLVRLLDQEGLRWEQLLVVSLVTHWERPQVQEEFHLALSLCLHLVTLQGQEGLHWEQLLLV